MNNRHQITVLKDVDAPYMSAMHTEIGKLVRIKLLPVGFGNRSLHRIDLDAIAFRRRLATSARRQLDPSRLRAQPRAGRGPGFQSRRTGGGHDRAPVDGASGSPRGSAGFDLPVDQIRGHRGADGERLSGLRPGATARSFHRARTSGA